MVRDKPRQIMSAMLLYAIQFAQLFLVSISYSLFDLPVNLILND